MSYLSFDTKKSTYPGKNGGKCKENCANYVGAGEAEFDFYCLAPRDAHVDKSNEIKERPQSGECHVEHNVVFACLDWGHLLKKPE